MTLPPVILSGNYFSAEGHPFLPVGAHWVPAKAGLQWPLQWDEAEVEADFAKMQELGFNTVRFDLFWAWFEPHPGDYNPEAFRQLDIIRPPGTQIPGLPASGAVHRRGSGRSVLGCTLATGTPSPRRPGDAAPADRPRGRVGPPVRGRTRHPGMGSDRRAALLDRVRPDHGCDGDQLDAPDGGGHPPP